MKDQTNLVWIDLEMSGLNPEVDVILEIALMITDKNLNILHKGPHFIIHHSQELLDTMNEWCKEHHGTSGLTQAVQLSTTSLHEAEQKILEVIKLYCYPQTSSLCGNSIWQDKIFLQIYMPEIIEYLHYRTIDVTAVKQLVQLWYQKSDRALFKKKDTHRALFDIEESIQELRHYREYFFRKL
jgi:oligoribonuclease